MRYDKGKHSPFLHRFHLVWITKYRYKVLHGDVWFRVREIIRQVCSENGVEIIKGVLASDHVHMFVSIPPKVLVADLMRKIKGKSSHKVQREFPQLKKRYRAGTFGEAATFAPPMVPSPKIPSFSTWKRTKRNPPAQAGSGLTWIVSEQTMDSDARMSRDPQAVS